MANVELFAIDAQRNSVAVLWYEPRRPRGIALIAGHGYSSSKHNLDALCGFLAAHGFAAYSIDFPGHKLGASGGRLHDVDDCIDAMSAAVAFAQRRGDNLAYTLGHSMGGMTALLTAAQHPSLLGAIAIATGYGRPASLAALQQLGATDLRSSYVDGVSLAALVEGIDERYDRELPRLAGRPVLYVAANRDAMVNQSSVRELYDRTPEPKWFASIDSDHTYAGERSRATVLQWLDQRHPRP